MVIDKSYVALTPSSNSTSVLSEVGNAIARQFATVAAAIEDLQGRSRQMINDIDTTHTLVGTTLSSMDRDSAGKTVDALSHVLWQSVEDDGNKARTAIVEVCTYLNPLKEAIYEYLPAIEAGLVARQTAQADSYRSTPLDPLLQGQITAMLEALTALSAAAARTDAQVGGIVIGGACRIERIDPTIVAANSDRDRGGQDRIWWMPLFKSLIIKILIPPLIVAAVETALDDLHTPLAIPQLETELHISQHPPNSSQHFPQGRYTTSSETLPDGTSIRYLTAFNGKEELTVYTNATMVSPINGSKPVETELSPGATAEVLKKGVPGQLVITDILLIKKDHSYHLLTLAQDGNVISVKAMPAPPPGETPPTLLTDFLKGA